MNKSKDIKYYWYTFEDGYSCCVRGMSKLELQHEELKHGRLIDKKADIML